MLNCLVLEIVEYWKNRAGICEEIIQFALIYYMELKVEIFEISFYMIKIVSFSSRLDS